MLSGDIIIFLLSVSLLTILLKMSKAKLLPDSIKAIWSDVRLMFTGLVGNSSSVLLQERINRVNIMTVMIDERVTIFFMVKGFSGLVIYSLK
jgi:hypothetical protein